MDGLELLCVNIEDNLPPTPPVQMVYAALVFEYVNLKKALKNVRSLCSQNGVLASLLQLRKEGAANVPPSVFTSLTALSSTMRLLAPRDFCMIAEQLGFNLLSEKIVALESGKHFALMTFRRC
jgi:hypothetical protein